MGAARNRFNDLADRTAILDDRFLFGQIAHGDLVPKRNVLQQLDCTGGFSLQGDNPDFGPFFQILDGDTNIVGRLM